MLFCPLVGGIALRDGQSRKLAGPFDPGPQSCQKERGRDRKRERERERERERKRDREVLIGSNVSVASLENELLHQRVEQ